ncbi:hypothetical protein KR222_006299, partial [Zaprionus bogoriensis]
SETSNWKYAPIRYIIQNPQGPQQALLTCDDVVLYFAERLCAAQQLQAKRQLSICCAAFRPWCKTIELAVGGSMGISLWQISHGENHGPPRMQWIPCHSATVGDSDDRDSNSDSEQDGREEFDENFELCDDFDFVGEHVKELQWLMDGSFLACAVLRQKCIQIWDPDRKLLMQKIEMPQQESYMWMLRFEPDMEQLFASLRHLQVSPDTAPHARSVWVSDRTASQKPMPCATLSLPKLDAVLTRRMRLQTAAWTACGNHLIFAPRESSSIYITSPNMHLEGFVQRGWQTQELLNLRHVECYGETRFCANPLALAVDPCGVYVAIMFQRRPYLLLCLLCVRRGCRSELKTLRFINRPQDSPNVVYPTCMRFNWTPGDLEKGQRVLAVAWSKGQLNLEPMTARTVQEA